MFQFGLFATHLPHLIIAAAYMIYFGTCAYQGNEDATTEIDFDEAFTSASYEKILIDSSVGFYDVVFGQVTLPNRLQKLDSYVLKIKGLDHFFKDSLNGRHQRSYVFSRPPPTC